MARVLGPGRQVNTPNATQQLAGILLDRPLVEYVTDKRAEGLAWRKIATALRTDTEGRIAVSHEVLRLWYGDDLAERAS